MVVFSFQWWIFFFIWDVHHVIADINLGKTITTNIHDDLILNCSTGEEVATSSLTWFHNDDSLYVKSYPIDPGNSELIPTNYSLHIRNVSLSNEGNYSCVDSIYHLVVQYQVEVNVPPRLFYIQVGSYTLSDGDYFRIETNETLDVSCYVIGVKPATDLQWLINNERIQPSYVEDVFEEVANNKISNIHSTLRLHPPTTNGTLSCVRCSGVSTNQEHIKVRFYDYVPPRLFQLMVDGMNVTDGEHYFVEEGQMSNISCYILESRPLNNIHWRIENIENYPPSVKFDMKNDSANNIVYDTQSTLQLHPASVNGTITCVRIVEGILIQEKIGIHFHTFAKDKTQFSSVEVSIVERTLLIAIISTICFIFASTLACVLKRAFLRRRTLSVSTVGALQSVPPGYSTYIVADDEDEELKTVETTLSRRLPEIPNQDGDDGEYAYYSDTKPVESGRSVYQLHDVCVLMSLKVGELYKRWTGILNYDNKRSKSVVITTASEIDTSSSTLHWNYLVRRLLELPENAENIVRTEGIYMDGGQIYLLQEHMVCKTLQDFMEDGCQGMSWSELMAKNSVMDILKGLDLIHSYGLLHPGLSRRKILVTRAGICKLYDFCLSEDVTIIVRLIKSKSNYNENQLPPESIQRNEYSKESDAWSCAACVWEIMTNGSIPFQGSGWGKNNASYEAHDCPQNVAEILRNEVLLRCWSTDVSNRPSISQLRAALKT
ncbi:Ephrin type-A receptor 1 [Apostichopus japonicus]|uniref:Ephrin type-A receptor 1 n=1 Tax=Stichopus japonicus TaxID=307972 RepID=A0A2G8JVW6_STIJA|nr:Ephrin type-A receptor 1 [Apostichopus japonicus]